MERINQMSHAEKMTILWLLCQVVGIFYVICAWISAGNAHVSCKGTDSPVDHNISFVLVLHSFTVIGYSVGGTFVMKKKRDPFGVGLVVGAAILLASFTFCVAIMEGTEIRLKKGLVELCNIEEFGTGSDTAVIVLGVFLTIQYAAFGIMLLKWKDELFGDDPLISNEGGYPSDAFTQSEYENVPTNT